MPFIKWSFLYDFSQPFCQKGMTPKSENRFVYDMTSFKNYLKYVGEEGKVLLALPFSYLHAWNTLHIASSFDSQCNQVILL